MFHYLFGVSRGAKDTMNPGGRSLILGCSNRMNSSLRFSAPKEQHTAPKMSDSSRIHSR